MKHCRRLLRHLQVDVFWSCVKTRCQWHSSATTKLYCSSTHLHVFLSVLARRVLSNRCCFVYRISTGVSFVLHFTYCFFSLTEGALDHPPAPLLLAMLCLICTSIDLGNSWKYSKASYFEISLSSVFNKKEIWSEARHLLMSTQPFSSWKALKRCFYCLFPPFAPLALSNWLEQKVP